MSSVTSFLEQCVFKNRPLVIGIFVAMTILMAASASRLGIDAGFEKLLPMKHEYIKVFNHYRTTFGGANSVLVALVAKKGDIFTPDFFTALESATNDVFFMPGVDRSRVSSLFTPNVTYSEVVEDGFAGGNVVPADFTPTPEKLARVRKNILASEYIGRLVANDFSGAIISAELLEVDPSTGKKLDVIQVSKALEVIRAKYSGENIDVHIIGFTKIIGDMAEGASRVILFFGITLLGDHRHGMAVHHVSAPDAAAAGLLADRRDLAVRFATTFGLRHRSHGHSGPLSGVRHRRQPRGSDGHGQPRRRVRRGDAHGSGPGRIPPTAGSGGHRPGQ